MNSQEPAQQRLASVFRVIASVPEVRTHLRQLKLNTKELQSSTFIWDKIVGSFSTLGSSRGAALIGDEAIRKQLSYTFLAGLKRKRRQRAILEALSKAKVRYPRKKARWLAENVRSIKKLGGVEAVNRKIRSSQNAGRLIAFLQQFDGIGPKYARNIMMEVFHPAFRKSIAKDQRIDAIAREVGVELKTVDEAEAFFAPIAKSCGLLNWELDRIMYWYKGWMIALLRLRQEHPNSRVATANAGA